MRLFNSVGQSRDRLGDKSVEPHRIKYKWFER